MSQIRAYLQLMRLPAVFTALADICLGFLLNHRSWSAAPRDFGLLLVASACLYLAGMVFNDVFDRRQDAEERPERPIPSGRVSLRAAIVSGIALLAVGNAAASLVAPQSMLVAAGLTLAIFAYDGLLKSTPLGPLAMGTCRFLNVMLGASAHERALFVWNANTLPIAAGLGIYIIGVTWFAREEARVSRRGHLAGAMLVINLGIAGLIAHVWRTQFPNWFGVLLGLSVILLILDRRLTTVLFDPVPAKVQSAVRTLLLTVIVLDATLVFHFAKEAQSLHALATAALLLPALTIGRWIYVT